MQRKRILVLLLLVLLVALPGPLLARADAPYYARRPQALSGPDAVSPDRTPGQPTGGSALAYPTRGLRMWQDDINDTVGMSSVTDTTCANGEMVLAQLVNLAEPNGQIESMAQGSDGRLYLAMQRFQNFYAVDLVTGMVQDLGSPVPDECRT